MTRISPWIGAIFILAKPMAGHAQTAQPSCTQQSSGLVCTISGGPSASPLQELSGAISVTNNAAFNLSASTSTYALDTVARGLAGNNASSGNGARGGDAGYNSTTNNGAISLAGNGSQTGLVSGLLVQGLGGAGGGANSGVGGNGGNSAGGVWLGNYAQVQLNGSFADGAAAVMAQGLGGTGGYGNKGGGGGGGWGGSVQIENYAPVSIGSATSAATGSGSAYGVLSLSRGGAGGTGQPAMGTGGPGQYASVLSTQPVSVYWTWQGTGPQAGDRVFGVLAESAGGNAPSTVTEEGYSAEYGGNTGVVSTTINQASTITVVAGNVPATVHTGLLPSFTGAGVAAIATGGVGGLTGGTDPELGTNPVVHAGDGGDAGNAYYSSNSTQTVGAQVTVNGATVTVSGNGVAGVLSMTQGGAGASGNYFTSNGVAQGANGGNGGSGGSAYDAAATMTNAAVSTSGLGAPGLMAVSRGGAGGTGATLINGLSGGDAGDGGTGGAAGAVTVAATGGSITTSGPVSAGILALSADGDGGDGGYRSGGSGDAGGGGSAGCLSPNACSQQVKVAVTIDGTAVSTLADNSAGVVAASIGGKGGDGNTDAVNDTGSPRPGGTGGTSGLASVTVKQGSAITTAGFNSPAILAMSIGGEGGVGTHQSNIFSSHGGNGGDGGNGGIWQYSNSVGHSVVVGGEVDNAGTLTTTGDNSSGIVLQSIAGGGGAGGVVDGISGSAGAGGDAGLAGIVTVVNRDSGQISTAGESSYGILVQSIGGNGGNGGDLSYANTGKGGNAGPASNGNVVAVDNAGTVKTAGNLAIGILAQSIGGGGGIGGTGDNLATIGGSGGNGGDGSAVEVAAGGTVTTKGDLASAIVAQSIGGGGGAGGNAASLAPVFSLAIGGTGGNGGKSGSVAVTGSGLTIGTAGSNAHGVVAQSTGGGGGIGGSGYSYSVSALIGGAVAVGGDGGNGGGGGAATVNLGGTTIVTAQSVQDATNPETAPNDTLLTPLAVDSFGVVAQSVGGGGGIGGSSLANAYVQDLMIPGTTKAVAISGTYSAGGTGGGGGNGSTATINVSNDVDILTYGNGSHALIAQSIGGGGGAGGDSSATSTAFGFKTLSKVAGETNLNLTVSLVLGADGGVAGNGGAVNVTLAGTNGVADRSAVNTPVTIVTLGDYADGVLAQSIGGGGGNAGGGSGSTQNGTSSGSALKFTGTLGGTGASGGNGGNVSVSAFAGSSVSTFGDGAYGIVAQSVGGGGGTSGTGSVQLGLPSMKEAWQLLSGKKLTSLLSQISGSFTYKNGGNGAQGGTGGAVTVALNGANVSTGAEGATAVLAQSVGGGGGIGGSAGSSGSSDDPTVIENLKADKKFANGVANFMTDVAKKIAEDGNWSGAVRDSLTNFLPSLNIGVSLGGDGGNGGSGGVVYATLANASLTTSGDYANALLAQSVGGGGGIGGGAVAGGSSGLGSIMKINLNAALGATGGAGGNGGSVTLGLGDSVVITEGYAANGIFAQSIGGGGGVSGSAQTNSSGYFSLGASNTGKGGAGGNGGTVWLSTPSGQGAATITTSGDVAMGVLLQSIGGGGGAAGDGFTLTKSILPFSRDMNLSAGGLNVAGNGGAVTFDPTYMPALSILTSGQSAYGILAQSIGGGGGLTFLQPGTAGTYTVGGAGTWQYTYGGPVSVVLRDGSGITTTGDGSHAIFAQSVGGGGGIVGFASGTTQLYEADSTEGSGSITYGIGGAVSVTTGASTISTSGASAYGIFAQSVGAGGGMKSNNAGTAMIAGTTGVKGSRGAGGKVTVVQDGTLSATGANAVGIFAQSIGQNGGASSTSGGSAITVNGTVQGGSSSQGWGIWVDGDYAANTVTIAQSGSVSAVSGQAIRATGNGTTTVNNNGTVEGSYSLPGNSQFINAVNAVFIPKGSVTGDLVNSGTVVLDESNGAQSAAPAPVPASSAKAKAQAPVPDGAPQPASQGLSLAGNFTQTKNGLIVVQADFSTGAIDRLSVSGNATLDGRLEVVSLNLLPNRPLTFLDVGGTATGTLTGGTLGMFDFDVTRSGGSYAVSAKADFNQGAFSLNPRQARVAQHLQSAWNAGGGALGPLFGNLANLGRSGYAAALSNLAADTLGAPGAEGIGLAQQHLDRLMSCPVFEGETAIVTQSSCMWAVGSGQVFNQGAFADSPGYDDTIYSYAMGLQKEVAPGWFFGIAGGYDDSVISGSGTSADGSTGWFGVSLKYEAGPWQFAAAGSASFGSYDVTRAVALGSLGGLAEGTNDLAAGSGRLRAAYMLGGERFYARPFIDLDLLYTSLSGYSEMGAGLLDLDVSGSAQWTALATPAVEFGTRLDLDGGFVLRSYARAGVTLSSTDNWSTTARLLAAPAGTGGFDVVLPMDSVYARLGAGIDLAGFPYGFHLRGEYEGAFSEHTSRNMGSVRLSLPF